MKLEAASMKPRFYTFEGITESKYKVEESEKSGK
jgi:hypothetical protein